MRHALPPLLIRNAFAALLLLAVFPTDAAAQDGREFWVDVASDRIEPVGELGTVPLVYRSLGLNFAAMAEHLAAAPLEQAIGDVSAGQLVALPLPDGEFATYRIIESPVMEPGLQERYPSIRTYLGRDVATPSAVVRLSVTPQGFHAQSRRPEGTLYIDPYTQHDFGHVRVYWAHDMPPRDPELHPPDILLPLDGNEHGHLDVLEGEEVGDRDLRFDHGEFLRTYRVAIAANRFYTAFHSAGDPTVEEGLAAVVVALNRINEIYEREITVRMLLVENNDLIIYTNAENDPYLNQISLAMMNANHNNLNNVIGSANYDVGHLFVTAPGGVTFQGIVCSPQNKGRAVSGLTNPGSDQFMVAIASHEFGHQFGAAHTFNGSLGGCGSQNQYSAVTSREPGSGSTIMSYAGSCGDHNIQTITDDYFHNISQQQMISFTTTGGGSGCAELVPTDNAIPEPILPPQYSIPISTPFVLEGDVDYDGDESELTFVWEGMNSGPQGPPPGASGWNFTAPFFRSFLPDESRKRFFPARLDFFLLDQAPGPPPFRGDGLPNATNNLQFRFTVRTNAPGGGAISHRQLTVPVSGGAGPFVISSHNDPVTIGGNEQVTITWDVANTDTQAFGAETVDILLSLNRHFGLVNGTALVLAEGVPNNGATTVTIPPGHTATRARFFVKASEGYFFAFNLGDITVEPVVSTDDIAQGEEAMLSPVFPNPLGVGGARGIVNLQVDQAQSVRVIVFDTLGREVAVLHDGPVSAGTNHQLTFSPRGLAAGTYYVRAAGETFSLVRPMSVVN